MPKGQNLVATEQITLSTTPHVVKYLEQLVATGLYGKNVAEAAERLLTASIEKMISEQKLARAQPTSATR